jgi:hypothetical protein
MNRHILVVGRRCSPRWGASQRYGLEFRSAFGAEDGRFVQIEELRAAILALMFTAKVWFRHVIWSLSRMA